MADKRYNLNFELSDGTTKTVPFTVPQGENGKDGKDGKDGYTPVKGVDYFDGKDGADGKDGTNGKDGAKGEKGDKGDQGEKGDKGDTGATGEAGKDYVLTEADKSEIAATVIEMLGGNPVYGYVDENNNIILSGNLADGTYALKFENEDGSYSDIGTLDVGSVVTDLFTTYTPILNQRYSKSSKAWKGQNGCVGFELPMADIAGKTMRFSGFEQIYGGDSSAKVSWCAVDDSNVLVKEIADIFGDGGFVNDGNNTYSWVIPSIDGATKLMVFLSIRNAQISEAAFETVSWTLTD